MSTIVCATYDLNQTLRTDGSTSASETYIFYHPVCYTYVLTYHNIVGTRCRGIRAAKSRDGIIQKRGIDERVCEGVEDLFSITFFSLGNISIDRGEKKKSFKKTDGEEIGGIL